MNSNSIRNWLFAFAVAWGGTLVNAEIPTRSQASLHEAASHVLTGKVVRTYERQEKARQNFVHTYHVAEISVGGVEKGSDITAGDRIFVQYWDDRWIGTGNPPPGHYGHSNAPSKTDRVVVYVKGDRKTGFHVLSPNGFFKVTKASKKD